MGSGTTSSFSLAAESLPLDDRSPFSFICSIPGPPIGMSFVLQSDDCQCQGLFFLIKVRRESAGHFFVLVICCNQIRRKMIV